MFEDIFVIKNVDVVFLFGKKVDDVREMFFVIYFYVWKDIFDENCVCLIELVYEYKI